MRLRGMALPHFRTQLPLVLCRLEGRVMVLIQIWV